MTQLIVAFRNFANAPKITFYFDLKLGENFSALDEENVTRHYTALQFSRFLVGSIQVAPLMYNVRIGYRNSSCTSSHNGPVDELQKYYQF